MPKNKTHKGLLKRIRITKSGKVRHNRAGSKHLRSAKSPNRLRRLRGGSMMASADAKRLSRLLFRRVRGKNQPRSSIRRSPSPTQRAEMRARAKENLAQSN